MNNFKNMLKEGNITTKSNSGGKMVSMSDSANGKLSVFLGKNKDVINISINNEYYVATDAEAAAIIKLFK